MKSPARWLRRQFELRRHRRERDAIARAISADLARPVILLPASTKGGYDEIYYAEEAGERFAVVRVNSEHRRQSDPVGPNDPGVPLGPAERLEREWRAYTRLAPLGLSPKPLWRNDRAIACSWLKAERASRFLVNHRQAFWSLFERILPLISQMHRAGVTHLDLNLGNILIDAVSGRLLVIDFEFGPREWVTTPQQRAFDYLRVLDDCIKPRRGGDLLLADIPRAVEALDAYLDPETRQADLSFVLDKLPRLAKSTALREALRHLFHGLP